MIHLEKVDENTFRKVTKMKVMPEQEHFVAPNVYSLAQAWLYYKAARPFTIMNDDEPVGFIMLDWDEATRTVGIWRFMIEAEQQNKGYGREALKAALEYIKASDKFDAVFLDYVPENTVARDLYYSLGFRENGEVDDDEIIMVLPLTDNPKVGITNADIDDIDEFEKFINSELQKNVDIPDVFKSKEKLLDSIQKENILRLTIMDKTIGLSDGVNTFIGSDHQKYASEVYDLVKKTKMK
ncbi:MAG: GNAT family N-acetyltransferase [Clostridiaceae bacterium]|jgi:diamine N-acetyltransferase|nr:GNAT family N-acetyltransferase [Clostridia bacterium]MDD4502649.1 GNAT family N-acetyltransferase [Clostridia bacterium]NLV34405.1 GNAT family N-acetyltransferase [Clostridiaceae bacterium]HPB16235.1 GNAT family N-acetyltransferase [Clostridia bacterium]